MCTSWSLRHLTWSCTSTVRIMDRDFFQAVGGVCISQSSAFASRLQALDSLSFPVPRRTCPAQLHAYHCAQFLLALEAAATAARGTTTPRVVSTPDRSGRPPWPGDTAATAWR